MSDNKKPLDYESRIDLSHSKSLDSFPITGLVAVPDPPVAADPGPAAPAAQATPVSGGTSTDFDG